MNKEFERYLILFLLLMLIGLSGCTEKAMTTPNNPKLPDAVSDKESSAVIKDSSSVQNIPGIVNALTCMFAPDTCEATKQERKMPR